jgi:curli biogenesis system outer membrane secretion channel CsgG
LVGAAICLTGCNSSKAFTKKGKKLEEAGLQHEAADNYYIALQKKRTNLEAQIGIKKTGQVVLNDKLNDFAQKNSFGNKKDAVYSFQAADGYFNKVKGLGVTLSMPEFYRADYDQVKDAYLHELYDEGTTLLDAENYKAAEIVFAEISKLDPSFKDASSLGDIAYLEPLYNEGVAARSAEQWRTAYNNFSKVVERQSSYKEAATLQEKCVEEGRYSMAILQFDNATNRTGMATKLQAYALDAMTGINDPFLKIVDRDNLQTIVDEQQLGLSGIIDEQTAVSVGELIGAKAIITGTVLSYNENKGRTTSKTLPAYEQYTQKKYNKEEDKYYTERKYKKINYNEYYCSNSASISFQYKVVSLKTGEVILSKIVEKEMQDQVRYATSTSEIPKIYPAKNNGVNQNRQARNELQGLFSARQVAKTPSELANDLYGIVSSQMKGDIAELLQKTVK